MNSAIAQNYDATKGFYLPTRRLNDATIAALASVGLTFDGETSEYGFRHCTLPEGWTPVPAEESPMQLRLHDEQGRLRIRVFYKPGSQGGGGSLEVTPRFTVSFKTDETLQWAEVYDGNKLIHRTATALRSDRDLDQWGHNARRQPEYLAAEAWLQERQPDFTNPHAYWH
ncbi:MAG: hypothetical protein JSS83_25895 [Cyanobacteria bacterium SZAS LIN-3]|nr:hypothetical protein [Cyanobacteria bacterium SZAS LIN-3]MBS2011195.1 hypothetical protein [Cyanobacteria bacterium SZAS TMP-1]